MRNALLFLFCAALLTLACASGGVLNRADESTVPAELLTGFAIAPSPTASVAQVNYALHRDVSAVALKIYDAGGNFVAGIDGLPARETPGVVTAWVWDLVDFENHAVGNGAYVAKLVVTEGEATYKVARSFVISGR